MLFGSKFGIQDSGFKIQDSKRKVWKCISKKVPDFRKSKNLSAIFLLQTFYFTRKFALSNAGAFHKNYLSVPCCTFGMLELRTLTQNRFKNQSSDTLNILDLSVTVGFHKNSLIVVFCTFCRFKFRILTPSRFKNQTNDTFKPPGHNCNYQQGFLK